MKIEIKDFCIRCGICEDLYPELFYLDEDKDEIIVKYDIIPSEYEDKAKQAIKDCAIAAMHSVRES